MHIEGCWLWFLWGISRAPCPSCKSISQIEHLLRKQDCGGHRMFKKIITADVHARKTQMANCVPNAVLVDPFKAWCSLIRYTVLLEIFERVLFSLIFVVGVGPRKLSARSFLRKRKFWPRRIYCQLHVVWFSRRCGAVNLLICLLSRQAPEVVSPSILAASFK